MQNQSPTNTLYSPPLGGAGGRVFLFLLLSLLFLLLLQSCRHDIIVWPSEEEEVGGTRTDSILGFYLLNEGNMGSNKCTMDYYDYTTGTYIRNIYGNANPSAVKELGDVGNDLRIYGNRMWAVINCSNKIEVMEARTARRVGQVNLANCRYIAFHEGYAYVTSYAGPVQINPGYEQKGMVVKIDTATLEKVTRASLVSNPTVWTSLGARYSLPIAAVTCFPTMKTQFPSSTLPHFARKCASPWP